jgi:hypothetical protein
MAFTQDFLWDAIDSCEKMMKSGSIEQQFFLQAKPSSSTLLSEI